LRREGEFLLVESYLALNLASSTELAQFARMNRSQRIGEEGVVVIDEPKTVAHYYYWAAFVLSGDWR